MRFVMSVHQTIQIHSSLIFSVCLSLKHKCQPLTKKKKKIKKKDLKPIYVPLVPIDCHFSTNMPLKISVIYYECITFYIHISIQYLEPHNISIECFQIF